MRELRAAGARDVPASLRALDAQQGLLCGDLALGDRDLVQQRCLAAVASG